MITSQLAHYFRQHPAELPLRTVAEWMAFAGSPKPGRVYYARMRSDVKSDFKKAGPVKHKSATSGTTNVYRKNIHRKVCTSACYIPGAALRAAGLDGCSKVAWSAKSNRIILKRVREGKI